MWLERKRKRLASLVLSLVGTFPAEMMPLKGGAVSVPGALFTGLERVYCTYHRSPSLSRPTPVYGQYHSATERKLTER